MGSLGNILPLSPNAYITHLRLFFNLESFNSVSIARKLPLKGI